MESPEESGQLARHEIFFNSSWSFLEVV